MCHVPHQTDSECHNNAISYSLNTHHVHTVLLPHINSLSLLSSKETLWKGEVHHSQELKQVTCAVAYDIQGGSPDMLVLWFPWTPICCTVAYIKVQVVTTNAIGQCMGGAHVGLDDGGP